MCFCELWIRLLVSELQRMTWTINELCGFRVDFSDACLRPNLTKYKLVIWRYTCDPVKISLSMSSASPNMFPSCLTRRQKVSLDMKCIHSFSVHLHSDTIWAVCSDFVPSGERKFFCNDVIMNLQQRVRAAAISFHF